MRYEVLHAIRYAYSAPVELGPHTIRLLPRSDAAQKLISAGWDIRPTPTGFARVQDLLGNEVLEVWFSNPTPSLALRFRLQVETSRENPFDFLPRLPSVPRDPLVEASILAPFRTVQNLPSGIAEFCRQTRDQASEKGMAFLLKLSQRVKESFSLEVREDGAARAPAETWSLKRGACRDLTLFFMECCRHEGYAARFVSGYFEDDPQRERRDLHAWAEVYVEGGGWRGFDPTIGMAVADRHIVLAAGISPPQATPVEGAFYGDNVTALLSYEISLRRALGRSGSWPT